MSKIKSLDKFQRLFNPVTMVTVIILDGILEVIIRVIDDSNL